MDAISLRLREVCPTLFRNEDAIGSKVKEILSKVRNVTDLTEKEALLKESLVLAEKISGHSRININTFCRQYGELGFPVGAVRLVASSAKAADPDNLAAVALKSSSGGDSASSRAFQGRADIYKVVFDMLDQYVSVATNTQSPIARSIDDTVQPNQAQKLADETIHAILSSDDEAFHITLYNWLLERKLFDRLLEIKHGYLDAFLQRAAEAVTTGKWPTGGNAPANDTRVLDLLWRHHEMNNNHSAAAQILSKLAESTT